MITCNIAKESLKEINSTKLLCAYNCRIIAIKAFHVAGNLH